MKLEVVTMLENKRFRICVESADGDTHSFMTDFEPLVKQALDRARTEFLRPLREDPVPAQV